MQSAEGLQGLHVGHRVPALSAVSAWLGFWPLAAFSRLSVP